jgi:hypothetical protein
VMQSCAGGGEWGVEEDFDRGLWVWCFGCRGIGDRRI